MDGMKRLAGSVHGYIRYSPPTAPPIDVEGLERQRELSSKGLQAAPVKSASTNFLARSFVSESSNAGGDFDSINSGEPSPVERSNSCDVVSEVIPTPLRPKLLPPSAPILHPSRFTVVRLFCELITKIHACFSTILSYMANWFRRS